MVQGMQMVSIDIRKERVHSGPRFSTNVTEEEERMEQDKFGIIV